MNCLAIIIIIITDAYWLQVFDSNYSTRDESQTTHGFKRGKQKTRTR